MHRGKRSIPRGAVLLVPFPFTDLTGSKVRPALVVSTNNTGSRDVIAVFISSKIARGIFPEDVSVAETETLALMGLKTPSVIKVRKLVTLDRAIILGEIGRAPVTTMKRIDKTLAKILGL